MERNYYLGGPWLMHFRLAKAWMGPGEVLGPAAAETHLRQGLLLQAVLFSGGGWRLLFGNNPGGVTAWCPHSHVHASPVPHCPGCRNGGAAHWEHGLYSPPSLHLGLSSPCGFLSPGHRLLLH